MAAVAVSYTQLNDYRVVLEVKSPQQSGPEALRRIYVSTPTGAQVPLSEIAALAPGNASLAINHQGQFPATNGAEGSVRCRSRLGGMLNYYYREAA